jgi:hypothetical protein
MGGVIADPKLLFDQHSHAGSGPDCPAKSVVLSSSVQQGGQLCQLRSTQPRLWARRRLMTQRLGSLGLGFFDRLTHGSFGSAESVCDGFLFPSGFIPLPATKPSAFAPIFGKGFFLAHPSFLGFLFENFRPSCSGQ